MAGLLIAAFVSIPIVNLATPLFAMSLMVHVHKRLERADLDVPESGLAGGAMRRPLRKSMAWNRSR